MTTWDEVAARVGALPRLDFARALDRANADDRQELLRLRFRWQGVEFAESVVRPILERTTGWRPMSVLHRDLVKPPPHWRLRRGVGQDLTLGFRGSAKTSAERIAALHALLYAYEAGIAVVCAEHEEALAWLGTVEGWLREPEVEGLYGPTTITGTAKNRWIRGIPCWARGWESSIRGLNRDGIRPTRAVLDDVESERNTRSEKAREDTEADLNGIVKPLGPPQGGLQVRWLATPAAYDAVASRVLRRDKPELAVWRCRVYPAVLRWPDHQEPWDEARSIYLDADFDPSLDADGRWERAEAFLAEHPEAFEGAVVLDPAALPIDQCYRRRWDVGELAWAREYMLQPSVPGEGLFRPDLWPRFALEGADLVIGDGDRQRRLRWSELRRTGAWDPSDGGDDGAIAVLGRERTERCYLLHSELMGVKASEQARVVVATAKRFGLREVIVEENKFGSLLRDELNRQAKLQGYRCAWIPIHQSRNKETRLAELEGPTASGLLAVREDIPKRHLTQFAEFDPGRAGNTDDLIDAVHMGFERLRGGVTSGTGRPPL